MSLRADLRSIKEGLMERLCARVAGMATQDKQKTDHWVSVTPGSFCEDNSESLDLSHEGSKDSTYDKTARNLYGRHIRFQYLSLLLQELKVVEALIINLSQSEREPKRV